MNLKIKLSKRSGKFKRKFRLSKKCFSLLKKRNVVVSLVILAVSFVCFLTVYVFDRNTPYIFSVSPEVAMPNELLTIRGLFFGKEKGTSSVYFSDIKVPGGSYEKWSRTEIVIRIPEEVSFGVVRVRNSYGYSNGKLFTGQKAIPQIEGDVFVLNKSPDIFSMEPSSPGGGTPVVITGEAFGSPGAVERLLFSSNSYDYHAVVLSKDVREWTRQSIRFTMPDGFYAGGSVIVRTVYGDSQPLQFFPVEGCVKKHEGESLKVQAALSMGAVNNSENEARAVFVFPVPISSYRQQTVPEDSGEPLFLNGREFRIFDEEIRGGDALTALFPFKVWLKSVSFEVQKDCFVSDCEGKPNPDSVAPLFREYVRAFAAGEISLAVLVEKVQSVMNEQFRFEKESANPADSEEKAGEALLSFTETKAGNAFDYAALFTDVLTKAGVESRIVSGYYLTEDERAVPHAWVEYRYPGFGYIPKDPTAAVNEFEDSFVREAPVSGGISCRYLALYNRAEIIPARLYQGFPVLGGAEGVFQQDYLVEFSMPADYFSVTEPSVVDINFR